MFSSGHNRKSHFKESIIKKFTIETKVVIYLLQFVGRLHQILDGTECRSGRPLYRRLIYKLIYVTYLTNLMEKLDV